MLFGSAIGPSRRCRTVASLTRQPGERKKQQLYQWCLLCLASAGRHFPPGMGCPFHLLLQQDFWHVEQRSSGNFLSAHDDESLESFSDAFLPWIIQTLQSSWPAQAQRPSIAWVQWGIGWGQQLHRHSSEQHCFVHVLGRPPWMKTLALFSEPWSCHWWTRQQHLGVPRSSGPYLKCEQAPISHSRCGPWWKTKGQWLSGCPGTGRSFRSAVTLHTLIEEVQDAELYTRTGTMDYLYSANHTSFQTNRVGFLVPEGIPLLGIPLLSIKNTDIDDVIVHLRRT